MITWRPVVSLSNTDRRHVDDQMIRLDMIVDDSELVPVIGVRVDVVHARFAIGAEVATSGHGPQGKHAGSSAER